MTDNGFRELIQNTSFVRLFAGRVITDAGDSLYYIGSMWLVWELTHSPFYTGLASALLHIPNALSFLVGPLVDRWQLRPILLTTQVVNVVGVLLVPVLAVTGHLSVWWILALMPLLDFVNGFVYPAQNAALPRIVGDDQLTKANSLFSTSLRTIDMVFNAVAGALISIIGAVMLYVVDAVTFAIAAVLFVGVTVPSSNQSDSTEEEETNESKQKYLARLKEGITYLRGSALSAMLFGMMVSNLVNVAGNAVLPAFADSFSGPGTYGLLVAALGAGSLAGAGGASLVEEYSVTRIAIGLNLLSGLSWIGAVAVPGQWATASFLFVAAVPIGTFNVLFGSMYQAAVDDAILGRVSSLVRTASTALMPIGAFLGGVIASSVGTVVMLYSVGATLTALGLYYYVHPQLRSLPPVGKADEAALGL